MRIAYVSTDPGVPVFGCKGASVHVQAVLEALVRRGDEVHLVTVRCGGRPPPALSGVQVHRVPLASSADPAERERRVQRADVGAAGILARLHSTAGIDLVYERYSLWGVGAMEWAARNGVASLLEVNAPLVDEQAAHRVLVDRRGAEAAASRALSAAGSVIAVSDAVAEWARSRVGETAHVHTLANGVDTRRVTPAGAPVTPPSGARFTLGFVGTLRPWHGVPTLAAAFAELARKDPSYRLLIVGDGPLGRQLRTWVESAGVERQVELTGAVPPGRVPELLRRMDLAVAPYPAIDDFYFSPLKIYEYLAAGLPVVASDVGDLRSVLDDGRIGTLVEPDDPGALSRAIGSLRADGRRRARMARDGRRAAVITHDWSRVVETALRHAAVDAGTGLEVREAGERDAAAS